MRLPIPPTNTVFLDKPKIFFKKGPQNEQICIDYAPEFDSRRRGLTPAALLVHIRAVRFAGPWGTIAHIASGQVLARLWQGGILGLEGESDPCSALAEGEAIAALFALVRPLLLAVSSRLR